MASVGRRTANAPHLVRVCAYIHGIVHECRRSGVFIIPMSSEGPMYLQGSRRSIARPLSGGYATGAFLTDDGWWFAYA